MSTKCPRCGEYPPCPHIPIAGMAYAPPLPPAVDNVVTFKPQPVPQVVALIEDVLRRCQAGQIQGVFFVAVNFDASTASGWMNVDEYAMRALGAIEDAKLDFWWQTFERRSKS